jgi:tRNA nucleotidyltransferase (CCA-adding enzyme)
MNDISSIRNSVLSLIKPGEKEKQNLKSLAQSIIDRINSLGREEGLKINAMLVGSSARGTWLSGERDLDIFIIFPSEVSREHLEEKGLYIARKVSKEAVSSEERYAEHPYINAVFNGFEVDLVPAFGVSSAAEMKSAVDRTPFHNSYVRNRITGLEDEVLMLKQFMKGCGVYGSELRTHGFSGYLVELLIVHYGSFIKALESACGWKPGIIIDIEKHGNAAHIDPLVVIDPVDPGRNVAAALSLDNMCIFMDKACEFIRNPDISYFYPETLEPLDDSKFKDLLKARGTSLIAIEFMSPDVVEDVLFPQLHKMESSVREMFKRHDFRVFNSGVWADGKAVLLYELESAALPELKKHSGPQIWAGQHAIAFKSKYRDSDTFSNVYIENGKYMIDVLRKYNTAKKLLESELTKCGLGKHVGQNVKKGYLVLQDDQILNIIDNEFRKFLRKFFNK